MRSQYPRRGRRYGTVLVTAALLSVCGGADFLPAQSALLDTNKEAFPAAPTAGTGALARPVRDALESVAASLQQRRFPSDAVRAIGMSGDGRLLWYLYDLLRFTTRELAVDRGRRVRGALRGRASKGTVYRHGRSRPGLESASTAELPAAQARPFSSHRAALGAVLR